MRVRARGAYNMKGKSTKSGNDYNMHQLVIEVRQESVAKPTMQRVGLGWDQKELEITPDCFERMQSMGLPFPCDLDITVGARVGFRGLESVIEDVKLVQPVKAAA